MSGIVYEVNIADRQGLSMFKVRLRDTVAPEGVAMVGTATTIWKSIWGTDPPVSSDMSDVLMSTSNTSWVVD